MRWLRRLSDAALAIQQRAVTIRWRSYLHGEFIGAGFLGLEAIGVIARAVHRGALAGAMIFTIAASLIIAALWIGGTGRWVNTTKRLAWARDNAMRILANVPHTELAGDGFVSFVVYGTRKRGLLVILLAETWRCTWWQRDANSQASTVGALLREAGQQTGCDDVVLWLPFARKAGWRTWLWPHTRGVHVILSGPWKLRRALTRWQKMRWLSVP